MAKKRRNPIHAYKKLLANDHDWDYAYLIALEKKKLQRMRECIKQENHLANNEFVVRDIGICIRLIDIFMEKDAAYNIWLDRSYSGNPIKIPQTHEIIQDFGVSFWIFKRKLVLLQKFHK